MSTETRIEILNEAIALLRSDVATRPLRGEYLCGFNDGLKSAIRKLEKFDTAALPGGTPPPQDERLLAWDKRIFGICPECKWRTVAGTRVNHRPTCSRPNLDRWVNIHEEQVDEPLAAALPGGTPPPQEPLSPEVVNELDTGIREAVLMLHAAGFQTSDSGDGISKPADARTLHVPHVFATVDVAAMKSEADRMAELLGNGWVVEALYSTHDGHAILSAMQYDPQADYEAQLRDDAARLTAGPYCHASRQPNDSTAARPDSSSERLPGGSETPANSEWVFIHETGEWRCHCGYVSTSWDKFVAHFHAPPLAAIPKETT